MRVLNMCDYCVNEIPTCEASGEVGSILFAIDLCCSLDEEKLNDAVVGCNHFVDNGEKGVIFIKV